MSATTRVAPLTVDDHDADASAHSHSLSRHPSLSSLSPSSLLSSHTRRSSRVQAKKSRLQRTFLLLSSSSVLMLVSLLMYYNYKLLSPHLTSLFWAVLMSQVLHRPQKLLLTFLDSFDAVIGGRQLSVLVATTAIYAIIVALSPSILTMIVVTTLSLLTVLVLYSDRHNLASLLLVMLVVLIIAFPCYFFLTTALNESHEFIQRARVFITSNPEFDHLIKDFTQSSMYTTVIRTGERFGYERHSIDAMIDIENIKAKLMLVISSVTDQLTTILASTLAIIANLSNFIFQLVSFLSFLFVLLESEASVSATLSSLSPFSSEENDKISGEIRRTSQSIFVCCAAIFLLHASTSYIAFTLVGIDLRLVLSLAAGFTSMLPIFSSWLVWLPAIIAQLILGYRLQATLLVLMQLFLCYYLDPFVYSQIKGNAKLNQLSIVLGLASFGATGVVTGPLLVTLTVTFLNIYTDYLQQPLISGNSNSGLSVRHASGESYFFSMQSSHGSVAKSEPVAAIETAHVTKTASHGYGDGNSVDVSRLSTIVPRPPTSVRRSLAAEFNSAIHPVTTGDTSNGKQTSTLTKTPKSTKAMKHAEPMTSETYIRDTPLRQTRPSDETASTVTTALPAPSSVSNRSHSPSSASSPTTSDGDSDSSGVASDSDEDGDMDDDAGPALYVHDSDEQSSPMPKRAGRGAQSSTMRPLPSPGLVLVHDDNAITTSLKKRRSRSKNQ